MPDKEIIHPTYILRNCLHSIVKNSSCSSSVKEAKEALQEYKEVVQIRETEDHIDSIKRRILCL